MENRRIDKTEWRSYFDYLSKIIVGNQVEIEVAGIDIGDQMEAEWLPLLGISYEPKGDVLHVHTQVLDHAIHHPRQIVANADAATLSMISISDAEGNNQFIRLRVPLELGGARSA